MKFKERCDMALFFNLHPALMLIVMDLNNYAYENWGRQLTITDTISTHREDKTLGRVSASHRQRRAVDIRVNDLSIFMVQDLIDYINHHPNYAKYHYVSFSGKSRLAYLHGDGNNEHIHLAIHSNYSMPELKDTFIARFKNKIINFL